MASANSYLLGSYAIRDGKIDPWGTFRILHNGVVEPKNQSTEAPFCLHHGLSIWGEKLVRYGKGPYCARVSENTVRVFNQGGTLVEAISHDELVTVEICRALVHEDGHLEIYISTPSADWGVWKRALNQAAAGEKPILLDNSSFVQVDPKFAQQRVIVLELGCTRRNPVVFTQFGERIPCKVHQPLAFAKWGKAS